MLYKDACNAKSNQQNLGTIKSSNLCTEIIEYSDANEVTFTFIYLSNHCLYSILQHIIVCGTVLLYNILHRIIYYTVLHTHAHTVTVLCARTHTRAHTLYYTHCITRTVLHTHCIIGCCL